MTNSILTYIKSEVKRHDGLVGFDEAGLKVALKGKRGYSRECAETAFEAEQERRNSWESGAISALCGVWQHITGQPALLQEILEWRTK